MPASIPFRRFALLAAATLALSFQAQAQVPLSGALSDSTTGPLRSGVVYHASTISVPSGAILTVEPGAIIKFTAAAQLGILGRLDVLGTAGQPVIWTDIRDDSAGGDTNGDGGATVPSAGWWAGLLFEATSTGTVRHMEVRYAGRSNSAVLLRNAQVQFEHCSAVDSATAGWHLTGTTVGCLLERCHAERCLGPAYTDVPFSALPGFLDCTAVDCQINAPNTSLAAIVGPLTVGPRNGVGGVIRVGNNLIIRSTGELTLQGGTALKFAPNLLVQVQGRLLTQGAGNNPVWFTADTDDTVGGDTNNDGALTTPSRGAWRGIECELGSAGSVLQGARIAYGGWLANGRGIILQDAVTLLDCRVSGSQGAGIDLAMTTAPARLERCLVEDCDGAAIVRVHPHRLPAILDNAARDNGFDRLEIGVDFATAITEDITVTARNGINRHLSLRTNLIVALGGRLRVERGVIFQLNQGISVTIDGILEAHGTEFRPVIFTSDQDNTAVSHPYSYPVNSQGTPGWWRQIVINPTADVDLRHFIARFGGRQDLSMIRSYINTTGTIFGPRMSFYAVRADKSAWDGMLLNSAPTRFDRITCYDNRKHGFRLDNQLTPVTERIPMRQVTLVDNRFDAQGVNNLIEAREMIIWPAFFLNLWGNDCQVNYSVFPHCLGSVGNRPNLDPQFVDRRAGDLRLLPGGLLNPINVLVDGGDPNSPLDPDGTRADIGAYPFNQFPAQFELACANGWVGCFSSVSVRGSASLSSEEPFEWTVTAAPVQSFAIFVYGPPSTPGTVTPFGRLCAGPSIVRTPPVPSGGTPLFNSCLGEFYFDFNAWLQGGNDPNVMAGDQLMGQFWIRDGFAPAGARFTDAFRFTVRP